MFRAKPRASSVRSIGMQVPHIMLLDKTNIHVYIYIYIEREREDEEIDICMYICMYICVYV